MRTQIRSFHLFTPLLWRNPNALSWSASTLWLWKAPTSSGSRTTWNFWSPSSQKSLRGTPLLLCSTARQWTSASPCFDLVFMLWVPTTVRSQRTKSCRSWTGHVPHWQLTWCQTFWHSWTWGLRFLMDMHANLIFGLVPRKRQEKMWPVGGFLWANLNGICQTCKKYKQLGLPFLVASLEYGHYCFSLSDPVYMFHLQDQGLIGPACILDWLLCSPAFVHVRLYA